MHTASVPALTRLRSTSSSSARTPGLRVEPNATSVRCGKAKLDRRASEELFVLRVGAGPASFYVCDTEMIELLGDAQLVVHGERKTLLLRAVSQRRVEYVHRRRDVAGRDARVDPPVRVCMSASRHARASPCNGLPRLEPSRRRSAESGG